MQLDLKQTIAGAIVTHRASLVDLSHRIHATPEVAFHEHQSSRMVADFLAGHGFAVDRGVCGLPTAFAAQRGGGELHVGLMAEYDSLPEIGHACGHNIIAATSVGAALGLAAAADDLGITVHVMGTPAEEEGGGKVLMLRGGAFDPLHVAMMAHPSPVDVAKPRLVAASTFDVHYTGKAAHSSVFPELGINAADAITVAQTAVGLLRQHLLPDDRVHGIVTYGGAAPNIVPARASARFTIRARTIEDLDRLWTKVRGCFEAGAIATGATLSITGADRPYEEVRHDDELAAAYRRHAESLGRRFTDSGPMIERPAASTDMGNVSRLVPTIHPLVGIDSHPAVNHQPEFAACCITEAANQALIDAAIALAWTAADAAKTGATRARLLARAASRQQT